MTVNSPFPVRCTQNLYSVCATLYALSALTHAFVSINLLIFALSSLFYPAFPLPFSIPANGFFSIFIFICIYYHMANISGADMKKRSYQSQTKTKDVLIFCVYFELHIEFKHFEKNHFDSSVFYVNIVSKKKSCVICETKKIQNHFPFIKISNEGLVKFSTKKRKTTHN